MPAPDATAMIRRKFVETLGLLIKESGNLDTGMAGPRDQLTDYKKGWLEGYATAWKQMTGDSVYALIREANASVAGCGKELIL